MSEPGNPTAILAGIEEAACRGAWLSGRLTCVVSFEELATLMETPGDERLRFARGSAPTLWTSVGYVRLEPRAERAGAFEVTAG